MHVRRQSPEPVFVDRTGRRRRLFAAAGAGGGVLLALASLVLVAGFTGAGAGYLPALPEPAGSKVHSAGSTASPSATTRSLAPAAPAHESRSTTASVPPATATPPATVTPSPTHTNNRRVPTQTPSHKPSK